MLPCYNQRGQSRPDPSPRIDTNKEERSEYQAVMGKQSKRRIVWLILLKAKA